MPHTTSDNSEPQAFGQAALSRWDGEGGAEPGATPQTAIGTSMGSDAPDLTNAELVRLRVRMIALENLVITLLAETSERRLDLAREMATYISPRPGFTHHPMTTHAAAQMIHLVGRAGHFRNIAADCGTSASDGDTSQ